MSSPAELFRLFLSGAMRRTPHSGVFHLRGFQQWTTIAYTFALVRHAEKWILLNTGFPDEVASIRERFAANIHPEAFLDREDNWRTLPQLAAAGVAPEDIDCIVLTCLGPYSTGQIGAFPNARICIGRTAWNDFHSPSAGSPLPRRDFLLPRATHDWLVYEAGDRLVLLDDEDEVMPGLRVFRTGGHHHGSMAVVIPAPDRPFLYGDTFFTYRSVAENIPPGWVHSTGDFHHALNRALNDGCDIVPAFDHAVFERNPSGIIFPRKET